MARHDGDIRAGSRTALTAEELTAMLGDLPPSERKAREDAIACYLAGDDGWDEAVKLLGGAFAADHSGLKVRKDD